MILQDADVESCLDKAKDVIEQYEMYAHHPRDLRSLDDLEWILAQYLGRPVAINDLRIPADESRVVRGMFLARRNGEAVEYSVYRLADLGDRERRFVTCKELFHVILDDEKCRNMDLLGHLEASQMSFATADAKPDDSVKLEVLAEIGAMEFLLPYAKRREALELAGDNPDYGMIAAKFGVPQVYVEVYLSEGMMNALAPFHGEQPSD